MLPTHRLAASFCALLVLGAAQAQPPLTIGASPSKFDLEIGRRPVNDALRVFNFGTSPARIDVTVHPWTLDEESEVRLLPPDEQSLDQWMIVSPVSFTIPPGSVQTVRFSIRPRVEPRQGEHRAMLYLRQTPTEEPAEGAVRVVGKLGVAVYGYVGEVQRLGELNDLRIGMDGSTPVAAFDISSIGTAHVRMSGHYTIWPADLWSSEASELASRAVDGDSLSLPEGALSVGWLPQRPVLPDSRRRLPLRLEGLPVGEYVLDIQGALGAEPLRVDVPFSVTDTEGADDRVVSN